MIYYLMNKDVRLASFVVEYSRNKEICKTLYKYERLPFWISSIDKWVRCRNASNHRSGFSDVLRCKDATDIEGFINLTHCLSLTDTLWVKREDEDLLWNNISLYNSDFIDIGITDVEYGTVRMPISLPDLTTDGSFGKHWIRDSLQDIVLLKAGSTGASNAGLEPYCEVLASPIYDILCDGISYDLRECDGNIVSACSIFTNDMYGYKSFGEYNVNEIPTTSSIMKIYDKYGNADTFIGMLIADSVVVNHDRHFGNFGFDVNNDTFEIEGMATVFDYNMALFPYADWYEGFDDIDSWIEKRGPVLGSNYYDVISDLITPSFRSKLINLKDLELSIPIDNKFSKQRLDIVNRFKNLNIDRILGNRIQFDFTDIRKKYEVGAGKSALDTLAGL